MDKWVANIARKPPEDRPFDSDLPKETPARNQIAAAFSSIWYVVKWIARAGYRFRNPLSGWWDDDL